MNTDNSTNQTKPKVANPETKPKPPNWKKLFNDCSSQLPSQRTAKGQFLTELVSGKRPADTQDIRP